MKLSNKSLGVKLTGGFAVILLLLVVFAVFGINRMGVIESGVQKIVKDTNVKMALVNDMIDQINLIARVVRNIALASEGSLKNEEKKRIDDARVKYRNADEKLYTMIRSDKGKELLASVRQHQNKVKPLVDKTVSLAMDNKNEEATRVLMNELRVPQRQQLESLYALLTYQDEVARKTAEEAETTYKNARTFTIGLGTLALVFGALIAYFLTRNVTKSLARVIEGLSEAASQVAAASSQVASSSQGLAEGASEQAASLEETSSSLEEMSSMTKQNADNTAQAKALMEEAQKIVGKVDDQMTRMADAIQEVTRSSEQTGKIIKTIDEIAFQTNLLALNAAVEAARAGEAGAGFAVVAGEVRNLAMRAADAAKNTSSLIENTIGTVKVSQDLTRQTQEAFMENMTIAGKIGNIIDEIATASQEQAKGISQITKAVVEMDRVVQGSAANAEESASASEEMNAQALQMTGYVNELVLVVSGAGHEKSETDTLRIAEAADRKLRDHKVIPHLSRKRQEPAEDIRSERLRLTTG